MIRKLTTIEVVERFIKVHRDTWFDTYSSQLTARIRWAHDYLNWCILQELGKLWRVSDCEELVRVTHWRWWGWFLGGLLFYQFSIHPLSKDVSIYFVCRSVPKVPTLEFPYILVSFKSSDCSLTMFSPFLDFPYILVVFIRESECSLTMFSPILEFPNILFSI